jgi:hypothetical protein
MTRAEPANPMIWMLVQVVEFIAVLAVLRRVVPDSTGRWLQVVVFVAVIAVLFLLNLYVVMPWIDRVRSRSKREGDPPGS